MQILDFGTHRHTQLCIQIRQGLVKQKYFGVTHNGTAHRHPLTLTTGELARESGQQGVEVQNTRGFFYPFVGQGFVGLTQAQAKRHVFAHRHVRVQGIALKHHRDVAVLGVQVVHHPVINGDIPARDLLQTRQHAQQGGFAATRRPHQHDELTISDIKADAVDDFGLAKRFFNLAKRYRSHMNLV